VCLAVGRKAAVSGLIHQASKLGWIREFDLEEPARAQWVAVGKRWVVAQGFVDFNNFARHRHVDIGSGFDRFNNASNVTLGKGRADGGQIDKTIPNVITRGAGDVGMAVGAIAAFPAMDVMRQALPMVLALLKMALVICIPLVLVIGTYDLKTVVTVSVVQFALFFVDFWFQLARWIDSTILDALYGWGFGWNRPHTNFDPLVGLNNTFGDLLLNFVLGTMFLVLPAFWVAALGWAGVLAGNALQGLSHGTRDASQAGGKGAGMLISAAKK